MGEKMLGGVHAQVGLCSNLNIVKRRLHVWTQGDVTQEAVIALLGPCVACARQKPSKGDYLLDMKKEEGGNDET